LQGRLDIETQCRGFLDIAKLAGVKLVDAMFQDAPFMDLFHKLYHTPEWVDGTATSSILATLNDYFQDYEHFIESSNFKRYAAPLATLPPPPGEAGIRTLSPAKKWAGGAGGRV
jgi:hypothetical protein